MGILSTKEEKKVKVEHELSESEMEKWKKSFEEYRVFEKKKIPTAFLGIPLLLWREIILSMVLSPKGSCDSCTFAMGRKNYFSLRLVCWQFLSMVGGDDELWKKVVSSALGRDSLRAWGEVFWDKEENFIKKRVLHSIGSGFLDTDFYYDLGDLVNSTLIARKKAINKWLGKKSKWELIALFAVYRPVLTVKIEQGINLSEDYVPLCSNNMFEELANLRNDDYGNFPFTLHLINTVPEKVCKVSRGRIWNGFEIPEDDFFQQGCALNVLEEGFFSANYIKKIPGRGAFCQTPPCCEIGSTSFEHDLVYIMTSEKKVCDFCKCFKGRDFPVFCNVEKDSDSFSLHFRNWKLKLNKEDTLFAMMHEDAMLHEDNNHIVPERLRLAHDISSKEEIRAFGYSSNVIKFDVYY